MQDLFQRRAVGDEGLVEDLQGGLVQVERLIVPHFGDHVGKDVLGQRDALQLFLGSPQVHLLLSTHHGPLLHKAPDLGQEDDHVERIAALLEALAEHLFGAVRAHRAPLHGDEGLSSPFGEDQLLSLDHAHRLHGAPRELLLEAERQELALRIFFSGRRGFRLERRFAPLEDQLLARAHPEASTFPREDRQAEVPCGLPLKVKQMPLIADGLLGRRQRRLGAPKHDEGKEEREKKEEPLFHESTRISSSLRPERFARNRPAIEDGPSHAVLEAKKLDGEEDLPAMDGRGVKDDLRQA